MARWYEISANRRALAYILFSAVVLGAMIFLAIMPTRRQIVKAEKKTGVLKARIERQEIFHPLYSRLQEKLAEEKGFEEFGHKPTESEMPSFTIDNVSAILSGMASSAGMQEVSFSPAPSSMTRGSDKLLVHGRLEGNYTDFRKFLIRLVTAPDFGELENLRVQSGTRYPEYRLEVWVTVK